MRVSSLLSAAHNSSSFVRHIQNLENNSFPLSSRSDKANVSNLEFSSFCFQADAERDEAAVKSAFSQSNEDKTFDDVM